jgi:hypothetical protein
MYQCKTCNASFSDRYEKEKHIDYCAPTAIISYANVKVTLFCQSNKAFICYCSASGCPQSFDTIRGLQRHAKGMQSNWIGKDVGRLLNSHGLSL